MIDQNDQLPPEVERALKDRLSSFRAKFGRDPAPDDPLFFDPDSDVPAPLAQETLHEMWNRLADAMVCHGEMTAEDAYAMKKTGYLVTEQTKHLLSDTQRAEWNDAVEEYGRTEAIKLRMATQSATTRESVSH
jgi:polyhydroxyalkanoate synthesis regulator phasin